MKFVCLFALVLTAGLAQTHAANPDNSPDLNVDMGSAIQAMQASAEVKPVQKVQKVLKVRFAGEGACSYDCTTTTNDFLYIYNTDACPTSAFQDDIGGGITLYCSGKRY